MQPSKLKKYGFSKNMKIIYLKYIFKFKDQLSKTYLNKNKKGVRR